MPPKKSLFNKPAWASKATLDNDADKPVFESDAYEGILEAQKRRQERHAAKAQEREEEEKRRLTSKSVNTKTEGDTATKKRRVSLDSDADDNSVISSSETEPQPLETGSKSIVSEASEENLGRSPARNTRSTPRQHRKSAEDLDKTPRGRGSTRTPRKAPVLLVEDDEEQNEDKENEDVYVTKSITHKSPKKPKPNSKAKEAELNSDSEEDEYIKELKRQAREKERRKKLSLDNSQQSVNNARSSTSTALSSPENATGGPELVRSGSTSHILAQDQDDDPEVEILIKTIIPDATACIVKRKASQPLDRVREFWCMRNNLDSSIASRVFFTWNGTRLYNSTTMRSILGQIKRKHGTKKDGRDLSEGKIEIEAVTQEIFDLRQKQKERERERLQNEENLLMSPMNDDILTTSFGNSPAPVSNTEAADAVNETSTEPAKAAGIVIRLISDSIDLEPMNLRVRPNTTMQRIVRGYAKQKQLDDSKTCRLVFDGDQMEEEITVEEAGFEDGDTVEVHIR